MLEGSTQGKMGVGTTQGKTNYPLRESYATHVDSGHKALMPDVTQRSGHTNAHNVPGILG